MHAGRLCSPLGAVPVVGKSSDELVSENTWALTGVPERTDALVIEFPSPSPERRVVVFCGDFPMLIPLRHSSDNLYGHICRC